MDNRTFQIVKYDRILWLGVHVALTWASYTQWIVLYLVSFVRFALKKINLRSSAGSTILQDAKSLSKIPKHLALILEDEADLDDLSNLILWAFMLGTSYVTVHQYHEPSTANLEELYRICERKKSEKFKGHALKINYHGNVILEPDHENCHHLMMSSMKDGRQKIAEVARNLCSQTLLGRLEPEQINLEKITESFQDHFPEPELAISFSSFPCLHGFQPWNARLTEILTLPSSHRISYTTFLDAVKRYAGSKQRFGK